jgi:hypothetical protein
MRRAPCHKTNFYILQYKKTQYNKTTKLKIKLWEQNKTIKASEDNYQGHIYENEEKYEGEYKKGYRHG